MTNITIITNTVIEIGTNFSYTISGVIALLVVGITTIIIYKGETK